MQICCMEMITIETALNTIDTGEVVSLTYVSFDKRRKTGGKKKFLEQAVVTNPRKPKSELSPLNKSERSVSPNNKKNSTRNFRKCINGKPTNAIRKVHVFLILEVNGQKVML